MTLEIAKKLLAAGWTVEQIFANWEEIEMRIKYFIT